MRKLSTAARWVVTLVLAVGLWGCATSSYPGQGPSAVIRVNNEHSNLAHVTVYLVPSLGTPERLGNVEVNRVRAFTIKRSQLAGTYRMWARPEGRRAFYSPEFNMSRGDVMEWDLRMNQVFLTGNVTD